MTLILPNEIRRAFVTRTTDLATNTTLGTATRHDFASITLDIPETSSRTFLSVRLRLTWRDRFTVANAVTGVRVGIKLGAAATDDLDTSYTIANTGDHAYYEWERDVTAYFNTNFGSGTSQTAVASIAVSTTAASNIGGSITACLIIAYEFDDLVGTTRVKTIPIPLQSHHTTLTTAQIEFGTTGGANDASANQYPALDTYLPEASKTYSGIYIELRASDESGATTDITPYIQIDAVAETARGLIGQALQTPQPWTDIFVIDTGTYATNAAHAVKLRADVTGRMCFAGGFVWVTYTYNKSTTTTIISAVVVPVTQASNDTYGMSLAESSAFTLADAQVLVAELDIQEPGTITLKQSAVVWDYNVTSTIVGNPTVAAATATGRLYTAVASAGGEHPIVHRTDVGANCWTLTRGRNRLTWSIFDGAANTRHNLQHAYAVITYTSDVPVGGTCVASRTVSFLVTPEVSPAATALDIATTNQRQASLGAAWSLLGAQLEGRYCRAGATRLQLGMDLLSGEYEATGFIYHNQEGTITGEVNFDWFVFPYTRSCNRHNFATGRMAVTSKRRYLGNGSFLATVAHWSQILSFHNITFTVAGTVTVEGSPAPNGNSVEVWARESATNSAELITSVTIAGGAGGFTVEVPDNTRQYFTRYIQAGFACSDDGVPGSDTFDITIRAIDARRIRSSVVRSAR